jgi:hypothetical protein
VVTPTSCVVQTATVGATTSAQTGNIKTCSAPGCLFGGPLPIINPVSIPTSVCVLNIVSQPASGTVECGLGTQDITLPVNPALYLTGDTATDPSDSIPGTQPCPLCSAGSCIWRPEQRRGLHGGRYEPGWHAGPVPDEPRLSAGSALLRRHHSVNLRLSTGSMTWTATVATNDTGNTVQRADPVFCGYCRDKAGTGAFGSRSISAGNAGATFGAALYGTLRVVRAA